MVVEIDQSGKIEQLNTSTAVAYSDNSYGAVWIPVVVKREVISKLRKRLKRKKDLLPVLFAIVIFLLVSDLSSDEVFIIDEEYTGKEKLIAGTLERLLKQRFANQWRGMIRFARIGKSSPAHQLAWQVHRFKNRQRVRRLTIEDILGLQI